jgi:hypothetical protein
MSQVGEIYKQIQFLVIIGMQSFLLNIGEYYQFVRAQIDKKPVRADLAKAIAQARAYSDDPEILTDRRLKELFETGL